MILLFSCHFNNNNNATFDMETLKTIPQNPN